MDWTKTPQKRDQLVVFPTRPDKAIESEHVVRLLGEIPSRIDWTGLGDRVRSDARPAADSSPRQGRRHSGGSVRSR